MEGYHSASRVMDKLGMRAARTKTETQGSPAPLKTPPSSNAANEGSPGYGARYKAQRGRDVIARTSVTVEPDERNQQQGFNSRSMELSSGNWQEAVSLHCLCTPPKPSRAGSGQTQHKPSERRKRPNSRQTPLSRNLFPLSREKTSQCSGKSCANEPVRRAGPQAHAASTNDLQEQVQQLKEQLQLEREERCGLGGRVKELEVELGTVVKTNTEQAEQLTQVHGDASKHIGALMQAGRLLKEGVRKKLQQEDRVRAAAEASIQALKEENQQLRKRMEELQMRYSSTLSRKVREDGRTQALRARVEMLQQQLQLCIREVQERGAASSSKDERMQRLRARCLDLERALAGEKRLRERAERESRVLAADCALLLAVANQQTDLSRMLKTGCGRTACPAEQPRSSGRGEAGGRGEGAASEHDLDRGRHPQCLAAAPRVPRTRSLSAPACIRAAALAARPPGREATEGSGGSAAASSAAGGSTVSSSGSKEFPPACSEAGGAEDGSGLPPGEQLEERMQQLSGRINQLLSMLSASSSEQSPPPVVA